MVIWEAALGYLGTGSQDRKLHLQSMVKYIYIYIKGGSFCIRLSREGRKSERMNAVLHLALGKCFANTGSHLALIRLYREDDAHFIQKRNDIDED